VTQVCGDILAIHFSSVLCSQRTSHEANQLADGDAVDRKSANHNEKLQTWRNSIASYEWISLDAYDTWLLSL